jgi:hypothetical protein
MEVSGQLHALVILPPVTFRYDAGWDPKRISAMWKSKKFLTPAQNWIPIPRSSHSSPSLCTNWTTSVPNILELVFLKWLEEIELLIEIPSARPRISEQHKTKQEESHNLRTLGGK